MSTPIPEPYAHPAQSRPRRWLLPIARPFERVSDEDDRRYGAVALAAMDGDRAARDALFAAFAPRLEPIVRRTSSWISRGPVGVVEADDVPQEAYLVFVGLIERWSGSRSFTGYVTHAFPFALKAALRRLDRLPMTALAPDGSDLADGSAAGEEAIALLEVIAADLDERDSWMLLGRIRDGRTLAAMSRERGISRRTAQRDWARLIASLRPGMRDA